MHPSPISRPWALKTGPTGLGSRATWAPAQSAGRKGRRPGVGGQGLVRPALRSLGWEPGPPYPSSGPPGRAASQTGKGHIQWPWVIWGGPISSSIFHAQIQQPNLGAGKTAPQGALAHGWQDQPRTQTPPPALSGLLCPLRSRLHPLPGQWSREATGLCPEWLSKGPLRQAQSFGRVNPDKAGLLAQQCPIQSQLKELMQAMPELCLHRSVC